MRQSAGQAPPYPYGDGMFDSYSLKQLYDLHGHMTEAARHLHHVWAMHLHVTGEPTHAAGDTATAINATATEVYAEIQRRYNATQPETAKV